jgi:KDO2-lipid IV(A) lauroyltransferase
MTARAAAAAPTTTAAPRATAAQRLRAGALRAGVSVMRVLPDGLVFRAAYGAGLMASFVMRRRRALVRANLGQVCRGLVDRGLATDRVRAAAQGGRELERMTRSAFGHWVLAYAESAIVTEYGAEEIRRRVRTDAAVEAALEPVAAGQPGRIFVGLHFGCLELAATYATVIAGMRIVAPMETVADPALQRYFERSRGATGLQLVPIRGAAVRLRRALAEGASAALVADRAIGGMGVPVDLFGAPARLPLGPAVLALETDTPTHVIGVRRVGWGRWESRVERLDPASGMTLRERIHAQLHAQARAFERIVADAPEQWWTVLFPVWERPTPRARPAGPSAPVP